MIEWFLNIYRGSETLVLATIPMSGYQPMSPLMPLPEPDPKAASMVVWDVAQLSTSFLWVDSPGGALRTLPPGSYQVTLQARQGMTTFPESERVPFEKDGGGAPILLVATNIRIR